MSQTVPIDQSHALRFATRTLTAATFLLGFLFSYWYLDAYYLGDQLFYRNFYNAMFGTAPTFWARLQETYLGSSEPLYRYLVGAGAYYDVDRLLYISFWNALLLASIAHLLIKHRSNLIFAFLLFTNYYLLVLLGPAERLKFAYLCFVLAFSTSNLWIRIALSAMSFFFHTQALVQFASAVGYFFSKNYREFLLSPIKLVTLIVVGTTGIGGLFYVFYILLGSSITLKMEVYSSASEGYLEAFQWVLILVAGMVVFRDRLAYVVGMIPMGVLTILFGNRVNVATFVFFVTMAIMGRRTAHPLVLAVMAYMTLKSVPFMMNVLTYGTGYPDG